MIGDEAENAGHAGVPDVPGTVARERDRVAADLRAVVVDHLHRLETEPEDAEPAHAAAALDATRRAAALGGLPTVEAPTRVGGRRWPWLVVGTAVGAAVLALLALVAVLLPASVSAGPVLVLVLAVAMALTARHAPPLASALGLAVVLGVLAVAAPFATTAAPAAGMVAGAVDLPTGTAPQSGACLLLGVVLAAAWGIGLHRRRCATAARRRRWLGAVDALGRCDAHGRLGLAPVVHRTLVHELAVLASGAAEPRRIRVARHRLAGVLPALTAVDLSPRPQTVVDGALDAGRVAMLVADAQQAAHAEARRAGRPPSVVVCGVPDTSRPEVGLLAARLLTDLVVDVASCPGPVPASVSVEHRTDAITLEVARGHARRAGDVPPALAERAAVLGGTVAVTDTSGTLAVRVVLPTGGGAEVTPIPQALPDTGADADTARAA
ncbi:hypothetical protein [Actinomycetospora soli]|uniref:hypothetical protein n=1 Tax=Actinomycetospora soli TaxID=2893887 RepID=UPI001E2963B1|nr:hypothetical protein [Actinomycetospora soli]MCD2189700.1 hypothetical protein [Actinomycetospora soli]